MIDIKARDLFQRNDIVGLFRHLGPMWLKVCMECLEDLRNLKPVGFMPNPGQYQSELRMAGIFVERMEVAMAAVLHKGGKSITWEKFEEIQAINLAKLPYQQRREVKEFWFSGPAAGLSSGPSLPPTIGVAGDWYVTSFSGNSLSVVVGAGFTAITGTIVFKNVNGQSCTCPLGLFGPTIGLSYTPDVGKMVSKLPGATKLMGKFPRLSKIITANEKDFAKNVLEFLAKESPKIQGILTKFPKIQTLLDFLVKNRSNASGAAESWWSTAIGLVTGHNKLTQADFSGQCVCYALTGAAGPGNFGTYVLFFGIDKDWSPISDASTLVDLMKLDNKSKGIAVISSASVGAAFPSLGAGCTIFWGEIV